MPASYTPQQKAAIAQFVGFTSTKDSVAAKVRSDLDRPSLGFACQAAASTVCTSLLYLHKHLHSWQEPLANNCTSHSNLSLTDGILNKQ